MFLNSTGCELFAKIMEGNYSDHINFNSASHLKQYLTDTYMIIPDLTNTEPIFNSYLPIFS